MLGCEDQILNTTEASLNNNKVKSKKKVIVSYTLFHWQLYVCYY